MTAPFDKGAIKGKAPFDKGVLYGAMNEVVDIFADALKVLVYFIIGDADNGNAKLFQVCGPLRVMRYGRCIIVLRAIELYDQMCGGTVEVHDILPQRLLPHKTNGIIPKKVKPQTALFLRHVFAQVFCSRNEAFVVSVVQLCASFVVIAATTLP